MPGRHLLLLCGKSRQKRIKGEKETVRSGFPPSLETHLPFDRSRTASARQARGVSRLRVRKGSSRDVEVSISTAPTAREPRYDIVSVSPRAFMRGGEPRPGSARQQVYGSRQRRLRYQFLKLIPATLRFQFQLPHLRGNHAVLSIL